jgi:hypothetical protein
MLSNNKYDDATEFFKLCIYGATIFVAYEVIKGVITHVFNMP